MLGSPSAFSSLVFESEGSISCALAVEGCGLVGPCVLCDVPFQCVSSQPKPADMKYKYISIYLSIYVGGAPLGVLGPLLPCILCQGQNTATLSLDPRVLIDQDASRNITMPPLAPSSHQEGNKRYWAESLFLPCKDLLPAAPASRYLGMAAPGGTGRAPR